MAHVAPAGLRFFPEYYKDFPLYTDYTLKAEKEGQPFQETKLRPVCYPPYSILPDSNFRLYTAIDSCYDRYIKRASECDVFEMPYFTPSYQPPPVNYNTRQPTWTDSRVTKDRLADWGNELINHDRAFGAWHHLYGYKYFYGDNRRL
ncbi:uncharacterized protein LOC101847222 [Aplysia californica]|uniref:Uncharacterized protein LOC101847222 n=1 Tax=Aplysia californica TaxID=6500 RepID=A0ABM1AAI4_APLCA|nr:uncharacterized protein LOC101847222 [Aplysia californica]